MVLGFEIAEAQGMTVCRFAYMMSDVTATGPTASWREVPTESVRVEGTGVWGNRCVSINLTDRCVKDTQVEKFAMEHGDFLNNFTR